MVTKQANQRNLIFISFSQFGAAFSFNFVNVFLPFYIFNISPYPFQETLLWVGAIIGSTGLVTAFTSTFWGSLTHRFSPKLLYFRAFIAHSIMFFLMGFTTDLHLLLLLRILQGLVGGVSTIGLIIVSSSSLRERISLDLGIFQSSMTLGQLVGPPLGSFAAVIFGFKGAFISASVVLFAASIFCYFFVTDVPKLPKEARASIRASIDKRVIIGWMLCFTAQIQLMFLPSVLPNVFEKFNIEKTQALKLAGTVVMSYTITAMIGTYLWSWLSRRYGLYRMITFLFTLGILFQSLLALSRGMIDFTVIRMVQTGLVAATIPLIFSIFVSEPRGSIIGFLNSARFTGNALGPMIATSILAFSNLEVLYLSISAISLFAVFGFRFFFKQPDNLSPTLQANKSTL
jgi:DHA1 family multidrug resistance protein-like MFS transporter